MKEAERIVKDALAIVGQSKDLTVAIVTHYLWQMATLLLIYDELASVRLFDFD